MYEQIKNEIDSVIAKENNCCSAGCSSCCHQAIQVLDIEFDNIKKAINNLDQEVKNNILDHLDDYWNFFDKHTPNNKELTHVDVFINYRNVPYNKHSKCPLLIDNKCSIYKDRPLTCRMHIMETKAELCINNPYRPCMDVSEELRDQVSDFLLDNKKTLESRQLAYMVTEILDPKRKLKPLLKMIASKHK